MYIINKFHLLLCFEFPFHIDLSDSGIMTTQKLVLFFLLSNIILRILHEQRIRWLILIKITIFMYGDKDVNLTRARAWNYQNSHRTLRRTRRRTDGRQRARGSAVSLRSPTRPLLTPPPATPSRSVFLPTPFPSFTGFVARPFTHRVPMFDRNHVWRTVMQLFPKRTTVTSSGHGNRGVMSQSYR